jgi:hypothetical protein
MSSNTTETANAPFVTMTKGTSFRTKKDCLQTEEGRTTLAARLNQRIADICRTVKETRDLAKAHNLSDVESANFSTLILPHDATNELEFQIKFDIVEIPTTSA